MADSDLSPAAPVAAHPMANPGYGKRSAPEQPPREAEDFAHLPAREASLAALIDRLPEGAAMSAKALAAAHPRYGQAACLTALRRLSEAGHLRRAREHVVLADGARWVTRTYFSRTPRDDAWWAAVLAGRTPEPAPCADTAVTVPHSRAKQPPKPRRPARSPAYEALADLCHRDPRLTLSAADCEALEQLAAEWLGRDPSEARFVRALAAGLPPEVHSVRGLLQRRLRDKMPPERRPAPSPAVAPAALRMVECTVCGTPGRPHHLPGGVCADCGGDGRPSARSHDWPAEAMMTARVEEMRRAVRDSGLRARRGGTRTAAGAVRESPAGSSRTTSPDRPATAQP
ncbi:hypothetical protein [Streptomyces sp. TR06-5]|uniref:hypothetical protein n=1 Tax=unclassified Streptomyces TaxID=2593676 RepID=UPI0039A3D7A2